MKESLQFLVLGARGVGKSSWLAVLLDRLGKPWGSQVELVLEPVDHAMEERFEVDLHGPILGDRSSP